MTDRVTIPYSGELLVTQLSAYGLLVALEASDVDARLSHSQDSLTYEPQIDFVGGASVAAEAIRASARETEESVEADLEPGKTGNDRRSVIWARASFAKDPSRAVHVLEARQALLFAAEGRGEGQTQGIISALGAPLTWGPPDLKPSAGATALDGVLGNNTSDLVRGVLRPARRAAESIEESELSSIWDGELRESQLDKTGWSPPGTIVGFVHQWLATLGLSLLPVGHRRFGRSVTPACWSRPQRRGITLPLFQGRVTMARLRAILSLDALARIADGERDDPQAIVAEADLSGLGVREVVSFERLNQRGAGSSVAFSFRRGNRIDFQ